MRGGEFFSHATAANLYDLPLPRQLQDRVELDVSGRTSRPRAVGVLGHRSLDSPLRHIHGLPVTEASRLFLELATILDADGLIIAGDALVRRKLPPTTFGELQAELERPGARNSRFARAALRMVRPGTDSPMETRLRLAIVRAGLKEPVIGQVVRSSAGDYLGRPDLAYPNERIAIEYEGGHHRTDARVFVDDITRRELMQDAGWLVIRVISRDVLGPQHRLIDRIRRALAERGGA